MKSTDALLDYLQGKKDNIKVEAMMNGHNVEVFNERETLHMADVKELLDNAVKARDILLWGGAAILAAVIASAKREKFSVLKDAYKYSVAAIGAFIAVLGCWAAVDFYDFWVDFHYLFFDNTLFFLDPNTSIMINMFPENFFFDLVFRIIVIVIIIIAAIGGSIHWLSVLKRRRETKNDQCCSL
jgi:integral membrane protein (TIGR01906 family)